MDAPRWWPTRVRGRSTLAESNDAVANDVNPLAERGEALATDGIPLLETAPGQNDTDAAVSSRLR